MIVLVIDKFNISADKAKRDAPVTVYPYRPVRFHATLQWAKLVARLVEFGGRAGRVKGSQDTAQFGHMGGLYASCEVLTKKRLKPFVPEANNHAMIVARYAARIKIYSVKLP